MLSRQDIGITLFFLIVTLVIASIEWMARIKLSKKQLKKLIRDNSKREYEELPPTPECFDYDDMNMAIMLSFIRGKQYEGVRNHLIHCCRCRHIYSTALNLQRKGKT